MGSFFDQEKNEDTGKIVENSPKEKGTGGTYFRFSRANKKKNKILDLGTTPAGHTRQDSQAVTNALKRREGDKSGGSTSRMEKLGGGGTQIRRRRRVRKRVD